MAVYDECPDCGGEVWDNRSKTNWKGPLWKCKDECGWVVWRPKGQKSQGRSSGEATNRPSQAPARKLQPLAPLYHKCLQLAKRTVLSVLPQAPEADILAAAATLFIAATKSGAPLMAAPVKPRPPVEPDPVDDDYVEEAMADDQDDLPF